MKNPRKQQMNRIPVLILLAALGFCSAQDGMPNDTMLNDGEDIQAESSEQRFLREPLDQVTLIYFPFCLHFWVLKENYSQDIFKALSSKIFLLN